VKIVTQTRDSIVVPEQAIISTAGSDATGSKAVFVVGEDGKAHMRPVELGVRQPGKVEIRSGVKEGERVITAGQMKVRDGAPVQPIELKKKASESEAPTGGAAQ
jgi:multidrug efflux pump subunit AcrA (membrane-fusion protein)